MPAACGMACEVCELLNECGGCPAGTDPKVGERLEKLKELMGATCPALECAMKKGVDYCLRCKEFPCELLYRSEIPYSKRLLDLIKDFKTRAGR